MSTSLVGLHEGVSVHAFQVQATAQVDVPEAPRRDLLGVEHDEQKNGNFPSSTTHTPGRPGLLFSELVELVESKLFIPNSKFTFLKESKMLQGSGTLHEMGIARDDVLVMSARLLGSSGYPGEWHCARCKRGGCWHTKQWCFRCGICRSESEALPGGNMPAQPTGKGNGKGKGLGKGAGSVHPREQNYPGRLSSKPQFSPAPTFSEPRSRKRPKPAASGALVSQADILPHLVGLLSNLGSS